MAGRTDFSVGVEGNSNKKFQAQPLLHFGDITKNQDRMRHTSTNIGPKET